MYTICIWLLAYWSIILLTHVNRTKYVWKFPFIHIDIQHLYTYPQEKFLALEPTAVFFFDNMSSHWQRKFLITALIGDKWKIRGNINLLPLNFGTPMKLKKIIYIKSKTQIFQHGKPRTPDIYTCISFKHLISRVRILLFWSIQTQFNI